MKAGHKNIQPDNTKAAAGHTPGNGVTPDMVAALRDGDVHVFRKVYEGNISHMVNFLRKLTGSDEDAYDITQEVFGVLWEKRGNISPDKNIKNYLFTIARHMAFRHMSQKKGFPVSDPGERTLDLVSDTRGAGDGVDAEDMQLLIDIAIANMPAQRRSVFNLYRDGLTHDEIAEKLDTTKATVKQQLSHARREIRELMFLIALFMLP